MYIRSDLTHLTDSDELTLRHVFIADTGDGIDRVYNAIKAFVDNKNQNIIYTNGCISIDISSAVEVIGVLPPVDSVTGYQVTPVVGIIPPDLPYRASEDEVSAVFEMPLAQALHLGRYHPLDIYRRGDSHRVWLSWYEQYFVWGMTACIIRELALQIGVKP